MKGVLLLLFLCLCLSFAVVEARSGAPSKAIPDVICVPTGFHSIQAAINAANLGDTVFVYNGTYYENVVVNKTVTLLGQNQNNTIIDGNKTSTSVIYVTADNVQISGFTVQNGGIDGSGIYLENSLNSVINGNRVTNNGLCGVFLYYSEGCIVSNNNANNNENGIVIDASGNCSVIGNDLTHNYFGLSLLDTGTNILRHNTMSSNQYNFRVTGLTVADFIHDIDFSNTVDGRPIGYYVNRRDLRVSRDVGFVGIVNSTNITVEDLSLTHNMWGVLFAYTTDSTIKNVNVSKNSHGIRLQHSEGCLVSGNDANNNTNCGIVAAYSSDCTITNNNASNTKNAIYLLDSQDCIISKNNASNNINVGIWLEQSSDCILSGNYLNNNYCGICLRSSNYNNIYHNNLIQNTEEVYYSDSSNIWDNGYEGNYWGQYGDTDVNEDGIVDTPYIIDENNQDNYPLMGMFTDFNILNASLMFQVTTICNSTVSNLNFEIVYDDEPKKMISFDVSGPNNTVGFCRIMFPRALIEGPYIVRVDEREVAVKELPISNATHAFLNFKYSHSTHHVTIIQALSSTPITLESITIALILLVFVTIALALFSRKRKKKMLEKDS